MTGLGVATFAGGPAKASEADAPAGLANKSDALEREEIPLTSRFEKGTCVGTTGAEAGGGEKVAAAAATPAMGGDENTAAGIAACSVFVGVATAVTCCGGVAKRDEADCGVACCCAGVVANGGVAKRDDAEVACCCAGCVAAGVENMAAAPAAGLEPPIGDGWANGDTV